MPSEVISILVWFSLFWMGTKFEEMYSKRNYIIVSMVGLMTLLTHGLILVDTINLFQSTL